MHFADVNVERLIRRSIALTKPFAFSIFDDKNRGSRKTFFKNRQIDGIKCNKNRKFVIVEAAACKCEKKKKNTTEK